ncbi:MAG: hypothetical protein HY868_27375 [Chloroflexi bacterium]|nr:hypothetical protein [Chloroflexota bacterium]
MPDNITFTLLLAFAVVILGAFAIGTHLNIRKGDRVIKWMRGGLPLVGERATVRWLGSSVAEIKVTKSFAPFRTAEVLFVFEPRDVPVHWLWSRWRGRRDLMIFRAQLDNATRFELEVFDPKGWTTHHTERDVKKKNWTPVPLTAQGLEAYRSGGDNHDAQPLIDLATKAGGKLVRLSVHRTVPNLEVHWLMPDGNQDNANNWFANLKRLAQDIT